MAQKGITPEIGEVIELMYPETYGRALAEFVGVSEYSVRHYVKTRKLQKGRNRKPIGYTTLYSQRRLVVKVNDDHPQQHHRFAFAHVLAWEKAAARKVPPGHVIVNLDGDRWECPNFRVRGGETFPRRRSALATNRPTRWESRSSDLTRRLG